VWLTDHEGFIEYTVSFFRAEGFFDADGNVLIHEKILNNHMVKNSIIGSFIICILQQVILGQLIQGGLDWQDM